MLSRHCPQCLCFALPFPVSSVRTCMHTPDLVPPTTRLCTSWYRSTVAPLWRPGTFGAFKMLPNSALCPPLLLSAQDTRGKPLTVTNTTTSLKTYYGYIRHPKLPCKQPSHALSSSTYTETHISRVKCPHLAHWRPPTRC